MRITDPGEDDSFTVKYKKQFKDLQDESDSTPKQIIKPSPPDDAYYNHFLTKIPKPLKLGRKIKFIERFSIESLNLCEQQNEQVN